MLLGILFFLSTSFNPVYQDKKFTKENFVSKIKADVETYNSTHFRRRKKKNL